MCKFIVRTCSGREEYMDYLMARLPEDRLVVCFDDTGRGAMGNYIKALRMAGGEPVVFMEDDIILTQDFVRKIDAAISEHPEAPIQFFSMRKKDLTHGSRWEPGRTFIMGQCHYFPVGMCRDHLRWVPSWPKVKQHPNGTDLMTQGFFVQHRIKYWLHVPSLVDHRIGVSTIDPRRAKTNRQSLTFIDPME